MVYRGIFVVTLLTTFSVLLTPFVTVAQQWKLLNDAGMEHYRNGRYAEAEALFLNAVQASMTSPGEGSAEHITALTNAAYAQQMRADYNSALANFRRALQLTAMLHEDAHIDKVEAAINLANAFLPAGAYDSCESRLIEAQELVVRAVSENTPHYREYIHRFFEASVNIQASLASLYYKKGLITEAIVLLVQQRQAICDAYPESYATLPMYYTTVNNLAAYYMAAGDVKHARSVIKEQLRLAARDTERQRDYLQALNNLGGIYRQLNEPDSAARAWEQGIALIESGVFTGSDLHIAILNNLGEMKSSLSAYDEALVALQRSLSLQDARAAVDPRLYQTTLLNLCETLFWMGNLEEADERYAQLNRMLVEEIVHNFTYLSDKEKVSFYRSNLSVLESCKFFAFDVSGALRRERDPDLYISKHALGDLFDLLLATKGLILHPGYRLRTSLLLHSHPVVKDTYERWERYKNEYATLARGEDPDPVQLSGRLRAIEETEKWLRRNSPEFRRGFVVEPKRWSDIQKALQPGETVVEMVRLADGLLYGALVLTPETKSGPVFAVVSSTASRHLEKQFYRQYANAVSHRLMDTVSFNVFWKPVLEVVRRHETYGVATRRIYFSPDGIYNRINLNTLWNTETNRFHIDEMEIFRVTNMKEILSAGTATGQGVVVLLGRPQYYAQPGSDGNLQDLTGTEREIDEINGMLTARGWRTTVLKHADAQEATVKSFMNPYVLHFATHGFSSNTHGGETQIVNNLLESGVVLAGGGDRSSAGDDDGILTAYEMMNLTLDSTRLVVLSACETGVGEYHTGEGIYGLQAALRSAGAESVVMSLWKVDDTATQQLMQSFYRRWLANPRDMRGAFRKAQQEMRKKFPDPYYWGAFVLTGQ